MKARMTTGWKRWSKFNAVGGIGILIQFATLALLRSGFGMNYLAATAIAVEVTILHNFVWHETFTWRDRVVPNRLRRLLKFNAATGAFSITANLLFTKLLVDSGFNYLAANVMAIALASIINFFVNDRLVFVVTEPAAAAKDGPQFH